MRRVGIASLDGSSVENKAEILKVMSKILGETTEISLPYKRDEFGVKPMYYTVQGNLVYLASEAKALLPFLPSIETDLEAFKEYITFQYYLNGKTLFKGIKEIPPAHTMSISDGKIKLEKYWELKFKPDFYHTQKSFEERTRTLLENSIREALRTKEAIGCYLSGGLDSSIIAIITRKIYNHPFPAYHGTFKEQGYHEDHYASIITNRYAMPFHKTELTPRDFADNISKIIYCLDYPTMGPGAFPQYMVAKRASQDGIKTLLGGQGGDELFGGYVKYIIAYLEQCIKGAIEGTLYNGNYILTYESIIPSLQSVKQYVPLLKEFFAEGLFEPVDKRYFRIVNRANTLKEEIRWEALGDYNPWETFQPLFNSSGVKKESYFDLMSRYDIRYGLPPMLQVEDRVSQAHGIESVMPFLNVQLAELSATVPSNIKFKDGRTKNLLRDTFRGTVPPEITNRKDKMGFPVPLTEWCQHELKDFVHDIFSSQKALQRDLVDNRVVLEGLSKEPKYSRKLWGLLSLELWYREFHDKADKWKKGENN